MTESTRVRCQAVHYEDQHLSFNKVDCDRHGGRVHCRRIVGISPDCYELLGTDVRGRLRYAYQYNF